MDNKIDEAIKNAIANLNVDDLNVDEQQKEKIKERLINDKKYIESLKKQEENSANDKYDRRNR